jgi:hypothetical protein
MIAGREGSTRPHIRLHQSDGRQLQSTRTNTDLAIAIWNTHKHMHARMHANV